MDIFCKIISGEVKSYTIFEDEVVKVILDVNPKSNGHSLVIPKRHYKDLFDIPSDIVSHIIDVSRDISKMIMKKFGADGITLQENNGISQDVKHFHLHIIPIYKRDEVLSVEDVYNKIKG